MSCGTAAEQELSEERGSPHREDVPAPAHSACMQGKRQKKPKKTQKQTKKTSNTYTRDRDDFDLVTLQHKRNRHTHKNRMRGRQENINKRLKGS